jgi:ABC-type Fe3+/spermidine/putrescine transport system ATPase subunit/ABC-type spermidine/putrescine transport system permease subunit II
MQKRAHLFYGQLGLTLLTCAFLVVPVIQSVLAGITVNYFTGIKSGLTLRWLGEVWQLYSDTIFRSIYIALVCLTVDLIAGVPAAYVMVKKQSRLTRIIEEFLVVPLAIPGLAIALAILISYGQWTTFRSSWSIILVGHVIFTLPFMIRSVIAVMSSFNMHELEEGAASLGAGFWNRFFRIVVPNAMPGIVAGALMVFTLSIGEFNLTWMLHTPLIKTLPVGLADSYASMRLEIGSAYTIAFFFMIIPLLVAMQAIAKPRKFQTLEKEKMKQPAMQKFPQQQSNVIQEHATGRTWENHVQTGTSVRIANCAKTFPDGTRALESTDLSVEAGQTVVILGPSGCGKTTTLRIIAGLETPDNGGKVFFGEEDVTDIPIEKRNVGMVFQSYALFPNMDVAGNIAYGLKVRGDDPQKRRTRVDQMLTMMQIEELKHKRIEQLSGGQKQRVALARAIAVRPRLLLLDEPLTALDAKLRDSLRIEIDLLLRSIGITAVYVTHDQAEAMALGDKIIVMQQGRIAQEGTPREVYFKPANRFVAEFVGTLNCLQARVQDNCLKFTEGYIPLSEIPELDLTAKDTVNVYFRPEHAVLQKPGEGHFSAIVVNSFFMGDRTRLILDGSDLNPLKVEAPGRQSFRAGESVGIQLEPQSLFTLKA